MAGRMGIHHILRGGFDPCEKLLAAVVYRAAVDARAGDEEAADWLQGAGFENAADWLDLSPGFRRRLRALGTNASAPRLQLVA